MKRTSKLAQHENSYTCSICHKQCLGFSNNAWPINSGRCCNYCNAFEVVPARIAGMIESKAKAKEGE